MATSVDQFCINVSDLEKSVHFYETVMQLEVTHRIETPDFSEVVLGGESGNRIQLAKHHEQSGPIDHGSALWKMYFNTDDCVALYKRCIDAGAESVSEPEKLEHWPVTAAFVKDPDGYLVEILEHHGEAPKVSGPGGPGGPGEA